MHQMHFKKGATEVYAYVTHGVLSGEAVERVNNSSLTKLVLTDSIEESDLVLKSNKIEVISISSLLGEAIKEFLMKNLYQVCLINLI